MSKVKKIIIIISIIGFFFATPKFPSPYTSHQHSQSLRRVREPDEIDGRLLEIAKVVSKLGDINFNQAKQALVTLNQVFSVSEIEEAVKPPSPLKKGVYYVEPLKMINQIPEFVSIVEDLKQNIHPDSVSYAFQAELYTFVKSIQLIQDVSNLDAILKGLNQIFSPQKIADIFQDFPEVVAERIKKVEHIPLNSIVKEWRRVFKQDFDKISNQPSMEVLDVFALSYKVPNFFKLVSKLNTQVVGEIISQDINSFISFMKTVENIPDFISVVEALGPEWVQKKLEDNILKFTKRMEYLENIPGLAEIIAKLGPNRIKSTYEMSKARFQVLINLIKLISQYSEKNLGISVAADLYHQGLYPVGPLMSLILQDVSRKEEFITKYKKIKHKLQSKPPDLSNQIEKAVGYTVIREMIPPDMSLTFDRYQKMVGKVQKLVEKYPQKFSNPFDVKDYPAFTFPWQTMGYSQDISFKIKHGIEEVKKSYEQITSLNLKQLLGKELAPHIDIEKFLLKVYSYCLLKKVVQGVSLPISGGNIREFMKHRYKKLKVIDVASVFQEKEINKIKNSILDLVNTNIVTIPELLEATFVVSLYSYVGSNGKAREAYKKLMIYSSIAEGMRYPELKEGLDSEILRGKINSLKGLYSRERVETLVDQAQLGISNVPKAVFNRLAEKEKEIIKFGEEEIVHAYAEPVGFKALFRGYMARDCTQEIPSYAWSLHPDNIYYFLHRPGGAVEYIGLSESEEKESEVKVLAIDTFQFYIPYGDNAEIVLNNLLDALEQISFKKGFIGIALPKKEFLIDSFDFDERTEPATLSLQRYQQGIPIKLSYLHPEIGDIINETLAPMDIMEIAHTMRYGEYIYLLPKKENLSLLSKEAKKNLKHFLQSHISQLEGENKQKVKQILRLIKD